MMGFGPGTAGTLLATLNDCEGSVGRRRDLHARERRLRERRHAGPARPVRLGDRDLAGVQLGRLARTRCHLRGANRAEAGRTVPARDRQGRQPDLRSGRGGLCRIAEPLLEVDYKAGERAYIRKQPHGRLFVTRDPPTRFISRPVTRGPGSRGTGGSGGKTGQRSDT